ncbi:MAG TPA: CHAT domain-containing protein [Burkholderiales bacterium]|nr:CHAT domain-containing protein [Burkholderiales bacterium]
MTPTSVCRVLRSLCAALLVSFGTHVPAADVEPRALLEKAEAVQRLGHRHQALEYLEQARLRAESGNDAVLTASIHGALGKAYLLRGRMDEARTLLTRALASARSAGARALEAAVLNDLGNLALTEANFAGAAEHYRDSAAISRGMNAHAPAAMTAANVVHLRIQQSDTKGALEALADLERETARISDPRDRVSALLAAGELLGRVYETTRSRSVLERSFRAQNDALTRAERANDLRGVSLARGGLARLYFLEGRHADAAQLADLALAAARTGDAGDLIYRWHWLAARVLAAQGKPDEALAAYRRAAQRFQTVRVDLIQELTASRTSYRDTVGPLFVELADLLLTRARSAADAQPLLSEAREVIEQFRSVELEDYFQDECVARLQARRKAIETVAADTAVLYPIFLPDRTELLLSISGRIKQVTLPIGAGALTEEIHAFREMLEKRTTNQFLPHAQRLYGWLFQPLEAELADRAITTIVLIPDGALRNVPIAALHDGKGFLVSRYAFAVAPGLSLLEPRPLSGRDSRILLSGLSDSVQNFPALPAVLGELASIEQITKATTLRNEAFSAQSFEKELRALPYTVVHIASHGQFDSDPKKSFLLTYNGKITMDDLEQYMKLTRFRDEPVELLTLSACRTAAGDDRAALGLAGIAIKAGARSALATLWFVSDQASSDLVAHFYELLRADTSKVAALQLAQQRMLTDPRFRHPSYWAPFLLIGNWL